MATAPATSDMPAIWQWWFLYRQLQLLFLSFLIRL